MADQREWPRTAASPSAFVLTPDGLIRSERPLAGPLRLGTSPGVGPRGRQDGGSASDFGTDRVEQRPVDSIGQKYPEVDQPVRLIAEETRRRRE